MNFQIKNRLKLSATYLAIIMTLSIMFSIAIYNVSTLEIKNGLRPAPDQIQVQPPGSRIPGEVIARSSDFDDFQEFRDDRIQESNENLFRRLLLVNLGALVAGTALSYLLARKALTPIERAMEKQDRFASDASHELRTPLAAMQSEIEVTLRDKKMTVKEAREVLESNLDEVKKMTTISSALLSLAHSENQTQEFSKHEVSSLINQAVEDTKNIASEKNIVMQIDASDDLFVFGDQYKLKQLFVIVLDNAIKYSETNASVLVTSKAATKSVQIDFADSGIGIDQCELGLIFDRFYRSDSSRTNSQKDGYGLGLSIAKNIVDLHKGSIQALNNKQKGTIIRIFLPIK